MLRTENIFSDFEAQFMPNKEGQYWLCIEPYFGGQTFSMFIQHDNVAETGTSVWLERADLEWMRDRIDQLLKENPWIENKQPDTDATGA